ncbi:MAG: divergent PAP2 family protein [Alicyclobacillus sp.]|nr:divergent PAP2 family protein [Alicyclobacillus sp.]
MSNTFVDFVAGLWHNAPLIAAMAAILLTQALKVPIHFLLHRTWDLHKVVDAGGMPSSHAAGVMALTVALAYVVGPKSPTFATAVVFAAIVMYDAGGIRRHAGEHAVLLNRIAVEISRMNLSLEASATTEGERLKEILGHEPPEVVVGALIGVVVGIVFGKWWP